MKDIFKHELGLKARDAITGFEGVITGRAEHLTGCNTYGINPQKIEGGKPVETHWFDENRIEIIGEAIKLPGESKSAADKGPDGNNPDGTAYRRD